MSGRSLAVYSTVDSFVLASSFSTAAQQAGYCDRDSARRLRGLGLPAANVSGYLRIIPPPGKPRPQGADATHAWVSLWCGEELGWIGFDPTNDLLVENDHIVPGVAVECGRGGVGTTTIVQ